MKTVLVTGASGLLGHAVVEQLAVERDMQVVAVVSGRREVAFPEGVRVEACNLLNEEERAALVARIRPEVLCHLAWGLSDSAFLGDAGNILWLESSLHMLRLFAEHGGQRMLFAGSSSEYGQYQVFCTEDTPQVPYSLYGITKLSFEKTAQVFCEERKLSFVSARYFSIYGPRDVRKGRALPTAITKLMEGEKFVCRAPDNIWDFIYIDDAAAATKQLLASEYTGAMNIASGRPISMREAFETLAEQLGRGELLKFDANGAPGKLLCADVSRMRQVLGYVCKTNFTEGIAKTIRWWKEKT